MKNPTITQINKDQIDTLYNNFEIVSKKVKENPESLAEQMQESYVEKPLLLFGLNSLNENLLIKDASSEEKSRISYDKRGQVYTKKADFFDTSEFNAAKEGHIDTAADARMNNKPERKYIEVTSQTFSTTHTPLTLEDHNLTDYNTQKDAARTKSGEITASVDRALIHRFTKAKYDVRAAKDGNIETVETKTYKIEGFEKPQDLSLSLMRNIQTRLAGQRLLGEAKFTEAPIKGVRRIIFAPTFADEILFDEIRKNTQALNNLDIYKKYFEFSTVQHIGEGNVVVYLPYDLSYELVQSGTPNLLCISKGSFAIEYLRSAKERAVEETGDTARKNLGTFNYMYMWHTLHSRPEKELPVSTISGDKTMMFSMYNSKASGLIPFTIPESFKTKIDLAEEIARCKEAHERVYGKEEVKAKTVK